VIDLDDLQRAMEESGIVFMTYGGHFTQSLIAGMTEALEREAAETRLSPKVSHNIFVIFIELAQNIMNYAKKLEESGGFDAKGIIFVGKRDGAYFICSKNIVTDADKRLIEGKLRNIEGLSRDEIKQLYKKTRKEGQRSQKGGGLGFLEIAKKSDDITYLFEPLGEGMYHFKICVGVR